MAGELYTYQGTTGPSGLDFSFNAPAIVGDHTVTVSCLDRECGQDQEQVWVKGLHPLFPSPDTFLIGETGAHPDNHYLTDEANYRLTILAALYRITLERLFPGEPFLLHLNDASLERGGIFDIWNTWTRPHAEHCRGAVIDIRANDLPGAIPNWYRKKFEDQARTVGADPGELEIPKDKNGVRQWSLRHYHVRLLGQEGLLCPR